MLKDLSKILEKSENQGISEHNLQAAAATLRADQFIWQDKHGHRQHYEIVRRFSDYFEDLFGAFGDTLEINTNFGYCCIIPSSPRPALKLLETLFLLILAKMHDGEMRKGCVDYGRSKPNAALLLDEYEKLTGKPKPKETVTYQALVRLSKHGIIEIGAMDPENKMREITVLPSIMRVVNKTFLEDLNELAGGAIPDPEDELVMTDTETTDDQ